MVSEVDKLARSVRRTAAVVAVLLAGLLYFTAQTTAPYDVGRLYHTLFAWTSVFVFWGALSYLAGSVVLQLTGSSTAGGTEAPDDDAAS